ncbi:hypothetical protein RB195_019681 [Necator americanus]|uniref:Uncharacterized protein n=1 Tax=Necator americanus TaxID=51031 RepID=A0ABR1CFA3_NECAM
MDMEQQLRETKREPKNFYDRIPRSCFNFHFHKSATTHTILPVLLIAIGLMTREIWNVLVQQQQELEEDTPLIMKFVAIETITMDQLQTLGC